MGDYATQAAHECGKIVLFIGVEAHTWSPEDFADAAKFARAHRVDSIAPKRADGSIKWYSDATHLQEERKAVLDEGCGYLPFLYSYGPKFGGSVAVGNSRHYTQVHEECAVLAEMMHANDGSVCVDIEAEYNGQPQAAEDFATLMRPVPGLLYLTTWADPVEQNLPVRQLAPCVNAWVPQDYDNWLVQCEQEQIMTGMSIRFAALDLSKEFGANDQVGNARLMRERGHLSLWLWEYETARSNPALLDSVVSAFLGD